MAAPFSLPFRSGIAALRTGGSSRFCRRAIATHLRSPATQCRPAGPVRATMRTFATDAKPPEESLATDANPQEETLVVDTNPEEEKFVTEANLRVETSGNDANPQAENKDGSVPLLRDALAEIRTQPRRKKEDDDVGLELLGQEQNPREQEQEQKEDDSVRLPRSVQAAYLRPLKRKPTHGIPACDVQFRSFSARNVEFMADFALRAAYYLNMPAVGPIPLPKIVERWTVPKGPFVHKKSQENWERKTLRRLVQVKDAHPETVQIWLAFLRKHQFHGVGMKANVWDYEKLVVGETLEANLKDLQPTLDKQWALFGREKQVDKDEKILDSMHDDKIRSAIEGTLPPKFSP